MTSHPRHRKSSVLRVCDRCREPWPCPTSRATDDAIASLLVRLARDGQTSARVPARGNAAHREGPEVGTATGPFAE